MSRQLLLLARGRTNSLMRFGATAGTENTVSIKIAMVKIRRVCMVRSSICNPLSLYIRTSDANIKAMPLQDKARTLSATPRIVGKSRRSSDSGSYATTITHG